MSELPVEASADQAQLGKERPDCTDFAKSHATMRFGAERGYPFDEFLADAKASGLEPDLLLSTWDLRPFTEDADFLVAILRTAG